MIFSYAAPVPGTFSSNALTQASNSLVSGANILKKIYFPRLTMPVAAVLASIVDCVLAFLVLLAMIAYFGNAPTPYFIWLPFFLLLALVTTMN